MKSTLIVSERAITGEEARSNDGSALDALIAFYRAFNHADLDGLAVNWAGGDLPSIDNPIGGIRRGWSSIREGYAKLFSGQATVRVELFDFNDQGGEDFHLRGRRLAENASVLRRAALNALRRHPDFKGSPAKAMRSATFDLDFRKSLLLSITSNA